MLGPAPLALLAVVAAFGGLAVWSSWRARRQLSARLHADWGRPRDRPRDLDAISDLFRSWDAEAESLDDRTWADLLLDHVFAALDRTMSRVGQQGLYRRLRSAPTPRTLDAFEALVTQVAADRCGRERAQAALARLDDASAYFLHALTRPGAVERPWWQAAFPLWSAAVLLALGLGTVWPALWLVGLGGVTVNVGIRVATGRRVGGELVWFRQVGPLLAAAQALVALASSPTAAITGTLAADLAACRRLRAIARWVSRDPFAAGDLGGALAEYVNIVLLLDVNALFFASGELRAHAAALRRIIETVGDIDAAIAVASFRAGTRQWVRPQWVAPGAAAEVRDLTHPLVEAAVPNSLRLAPPHGLLITGSNMSGKSTLLRTVGVNAVLAQTIHTCLASSYVAPVYRVRSSMGRADDLIAGKSYYLAEVEAILSLVRASAGTTPCLFLLDELFRGTNAVERIAAADAVLRTLVDGGRPHVALVATHDGELVELLRGEYAVCHLGDAVGPAGLVFDYRLTPGPSTSRNAIALLRLSGAPEALVAQALARAAAMDQQQTGAQAAPGSIGNTRAGRSFP